VSAALAEIVVNAPGVYDLPAATYHADPVPGGSLSSSGARRLLPPGCPALFHHWATKGQEHRAAFDFGHAAHALVLGVGSSLVVIDAPDWRTKRAQTERDAAHSSGAAPLLIADYRRAQAMAEAVHAHPIAGALLSSPDGAAEQTLVWVDPEFDVWRRAMIDWVTYGNTGRVLVVDYKTTDSAEPGAVSRSVANYGYHNQGAWYLDAVEGLGLTGAAEDPAFILICQEKHPPYLVTVVQLDPEAIQWGRVQNRKAIEIYRECTESGHWPGYTDRIRSLSLPGWADRQYAVAWERGDYDTIKDLP
jgi:hypothetical protein